MKRLKRILAVLTIAGAALVVLLGVGIVLTVRALVLPDFGKFGTLKDEAAQVGLSRTDFEPATDEYFVAMDKGVLAARTGADGAPAYSQGVVRATQILHAAELAAIRQQLADENLTPTVAREQMDALYEQVRLAAVSGQNMWNVWTGGNDRFWDLMSGSPTFGNFDLLKVISSHPSQAYGREDRWRYLGLVNEPCMRAASAESAQERFGLWLDFRDPNCAGPADPFENSERYPGVEIGARGRTLTNRTTGESVVLPIGSYYGEPTGILGLRLFTNPAFDQAAFEKWDAERYYSDPEYYQDADLIRPYRVGMACGFCHVGPSPVSPPPDPTNPSFEHVNSNPGAQYFWVDRIFIWNTRPRSDPAIPAANEHNFIYQLFHTNPPGTLDTSLVSTDYMNNPRTMNAVYRLAARLGPTERWGTETLAGGELDNKQFQDYPETSGLGGFWNAASGQVKTARVLKDGSDSVGVLGALNRVYANIGVFSEEWTLHFRPVVGGQKISPFRISDAQRNSAYWGATEDMTPDMAIFFLVTASSDDLRAAPGGQPHLTSDPAKLKRGKIVFAENCAGCHSSKIPPAPPNSGVDADVCEHGGNGAQYRECWDRYWNWVRSDEFKQQMAEMVLEDDFLENNFLSSERRVPVDVLGTNACGPLATNALRDDIWDNFSSASYKQLPPPRELTVHHPVSGGVASFQPLGNGRGYTRPASLVSIWSTAPFLQNNSVGHVEYAYGDAGYYPRGGYAAGSYVRDRMPSVGAGGGLEGAYDKGPQSPDATTVPRSEASEGTASEGMRRHAGACPAGDATDPYLPCVDNRMRVFEDSIYKLLNPEARRRDSLLGERVPGYMYRTTAASCIMIPSGYLPSIFGAMPGLFNAIADWAFDEQGGLTLGPLPEGFPINVLTNTQLLPDNDEPDTWGHYLKLAKAMPTFYRTFRDLGGACSARELDSPGVQQRAERVLQETQLIDTLVGLSKCPDYVVNRGHTFGAELSSGDKRALIEFLKRM